MTKSEAPVITKLSAKAAETFVPTGIDQFDAIIGGGFYRGRITELYGGEGVGKTYLVSKLMAVLSKKHKVLYVDAEFSLNKDRVAALGADVENVDYIADSRLEEVCELINTSIGKYDVIILDEAHLLKERGSYRTEYMFAVLTPLTIETSEIGTTSIGLFSRLIKHWVVKMRPRLGRSQTAMIVINQVRKPIGLYAKMEPPGGMAFAHACDVRIHLTTAKSDGVMKGGVQVGHKVHATVKKSKVSAPFVETTYLVNY